MQFFLDKIEANPDDPVYAHFELVPDHLPDALKEGISKFPPGALQFEIGIQSFNPEVQALVSRRQDNAKAADNIRWLMEHSHAHLHVDLIAGLPGEDVESFARGFNQLVTLGPHEIQFGILKRLRGTPIIRHTQNFGMVFDPYPPYTILATNLIDFGTMALALLLRSWGRPFACVVDHGLREESAAEAGVTMRRLAELGISARLLRADLSHGPGLAERARAARYTLLAVACRDAGLADLALGHHLRDQAETLLLRRASGSGVTGLSGMAAVVHTKFTRLLRPLLAVPPARLRATLRAAGVGWVEDPSNADPTAPRARLRAGPLSGLAAAAKFSAEARTHGDVRAAVEAQAAADLAASATIYSYGVAHLRAPIGQHALSALIWTLSGDAHPPPSAGVLRLSACLHADAAHDATLHGARVMPARRLGLGWLVGREASAMEEAVFLDQRWDGRFQAVPGVGSQGMTLGPLGSDAARLRRRSALPSALLQTLPTLRRDGAIVAVPHLCYPDSAACRGASVLFRPARPAAPAPFVAA